MEENHEPCSSAGSPESFTCQECLDVLHMVIDDETEKSHAFKQHLDDCLPCLERYNLDKAIKDVLKKKCNNSTPPPGLIEDIKSRIFRNSPS